MVGGGRRRRRSGHRPNLRPRCWEKEGAVVAVLVRVGVGAPGVGHLGGQV